MPKFVIERDVPGVGKLSDAQLREISQKSVAVLKEMGVGIQWLHSYVTGDKVYCVYLAPDEATILEHARRTGLPANRISASSIRQARNNFSPERIPLTSTIARDLPTALLRSLSRPAAPSLRTRPSRSRCCPMPAAPCADWLQVLRVLPE